MKIQLQNTKYYPSVGGIENYLYYTSKELIKMGHEPTILCSKHQTHLTEKEEYDGIKIIRHPNYQLPQIPFAPINSFYYVYKLEDFMKNRSSDYDVIWSRILYEAYASGKAYKDKIPKIFILASIGSRLSKIALSNASLVNKANMITSIWLQDNYIEKRALEMSDKIVVLSSSKKKEVSNFHHIESKKIEIVPPGVDMELFKPSAEKDKYILEELKLPKDCKIVLTVCRLSKEKNVPMLIKAFSQLNVNNSYLIIVGNGLERKNLEYLVKILGIESKVRFVGNRKDVERFYSIADVFVLPSTYEGFGQVFLESMASGVPCIGLKQDYPDVIVASDEIIKNGKTGFLINHYDLNDLSEKIERIILDDYLKNKLGTHAREVCEQKYTWEKSVRSLLEISKRI